jgi:hypothetical protein
LCQFWNRLEADQLAAVADPSSEEVGVLPSVGADINDEINAQQSEKATQVVCLLMIANARPMQQPVIERATKPTNGALP